MYSPNTTATKLAPFINKGITIPEIIDNIKQRSDFDGHHEEATNIVLKALSTISTNKPQKVAKKKRKSELISEDQQLTLNAFSKKLTKKGLSKSTISIYVSQIKRVMIDNPGQLTGNEEIVSKYKTSISNYLSLMGIRKKKRKKTKRKKIVVLSSSSEEENISQVSNNDSVYTPRNTVKKSPTPRVTVKKVSTPLSNVSVVDSDDNSAKNTFTPVPEEKEQVPTLEKANGKEKVVVTPKLVVSKAPPPTLKKIKDLSFGCLIKNNKVTHYGLIALQAINKVHMPKVMTGIKKVCDKQSGYYPFEEITSYKCRIILNKILDSRNNAYWYDFGLLLNCYIANVRCSKFLSEFRELFTDEIKYQYQNKYSLTHGFMTSYLK